MCNGESLSEDLDKQLRDYIADNYPMVEDFDYNFIDDGRKITLTGRISMPSSEIIIDAISDIEKMLDVHYVGVRSINGSHAFTYEFNE